MQDLQFACAAWSWYRPAEQLVQLPMGAGPNLPAAHIWQNTALFGEFSYPAGQELHAVRASSSEYLPAAQLVQLACLVSDWYFPGVHS